jgi:hypothetical protein
VGGWGRAAEGEGEGVGVGGGEGEGEGNGGGGGERVRGRGRGRESEGGRDLHDEAGPVDGERLALGRALEHRPARCDQGSKGKREVVKLTRKWSNRPVAKVVKQAS